MNKKLTATEYKKLFNEKNPALTLLEKYVNRHFPLRVKDKYTGKVYEELPDSYLMGRLNNQIVKKHNAEVTKEREEEIKKIKKDKIKKEKDRAKKLALTTKIKKRKAKKPVAATNTKNKVAKSQTISGKSKMDKSIRKLLEMKEPDLKGKYIHNSRYETYVNYLLKESGIEYYSEKSFPWAKRTLDSGHIGRFRYDFYVPNKVLIEYDGEHHYRETDFFDFSLKDQQERDLLKDRLADEHGLHVYRIRTRSWKKLKIQLANAILDGNK